MSEDTPAIIVLGMILGSGKSSRLYRRLVDTALASAVENMAHPFKDNALFLTYAWLNKGVAPEKIEGIILEEYEKIKRTGVSKEEVKRAEAKAISSMVFSRDGSYSAAGVLNEAISVGDWAFYTKLLEGVGKVSPADIKRVAGKYLVEDFSTTGFFIADSKSSPSPKKKK
jgi:zinc protease